MLKKFPYNGLMEINRCIMINGKSKIANLVLYHKRKDIRFCKKIQMQSSGFQYKHKVIR
jgi:hypothetical protein